MKNLRFSYMHRDEENFKSCGHAIFWGPATEEHITRLKEAFRDGEEFIAEAVDIDTVYTIGGKPCEWHEVLNLELTDRSPRNDGRTAEQFVQAVEAAAERGWERILEEANTKYYLLDVHGCVEPHALGPYPTSAKRDEEARRVRRRQDDLEDALFWADVDEKGQLLVGAYMSGYFEYEEE